MSKPVIGVTVGTPTSPAKIANEIKPVKTVNGKAPDKNGNVEVEGGGIDIANAYVGQTIVVKAVDENGKPTEWESADFPESGANIITAESKDELPDPASVPEGTIALVKSEGGDGGNYKVIDLSDPSKYAITGEMFGTLGEMLAVMIATGQTVCTTIGNWRSAVLAAFSEFDTTKPVMVKFSVDMEGSTLSCELTTVNTARMNGVLYQAGFTGDLVYGGVISFAVVLLVDGGLTIKTSKTDIVE